MPLIQKLIQRDAGSHGSVDSNMPQPSSLPESAFVDILSALASLPAFPQLLATVNEQGQTLLHLAVHLRYRELVRKLINWGIGLNVRDINGSTALHAAYLCDDALVIGVLEAEGATPFVLDELGRSPIGLRAAIPDISSRVATRTEKDNVPLAVGDISQLNEQRRPSDPAVPMETHETMLESTAEEGCPSEYVIFRRAIINR